MPGSTSVVTLAPPLLLWAVSVYKLPALSRSSEPALSAYWASIAWLAVAMTLLVPPFAGWLDRLAHVTDLAWLLMYAAVLLSGFSATIALMYETPDPRNANRERRRRWGCSLLIGTLLALFAAGQPTVETADFVRAYGAQPATAVFLTIFYAGLSFVCVDMIPRCLAIARAVSGLLRLALRGSAGAAALALLYVAYNELVVVQLVTGNSAAILGDPLTLSRLLLLLIVALIGIGTSLPDWGPRLGLDRVGPFLSQYADRLRVFGVWYDVRTVVPTADVPSPAGRLRPLAPQRWSRWLGRRRAAALRDLLSLRDARFQLHRRVMDVTDGRLTLIRNGYEDRAVVEHLLGTLPPQDRCGRPAQEAAGLAASIAAKAAGRPPGTAVRSSARPAANLDRWDLEDDVAHLVEVAGYYRGFAGALRSRAAIHEPATSPPASSQT